jgi:hypothetical protein
MISVMDFGTNNPNHSLTVAGAEIRLRVPEPVEPWRASPDNFREGMPLPGVRAIRSDTPCDACGSPIFGRAYARVAIRCRGGAVPDRAFTVCEACADRLPGRRVSRSSPIGR